MRTHLEALKPRPLLSSTIVVKQSKPRGPRVKTNLDGSLRHVRTAYVQSNRLWLIVITYDPATKGSFFKVRVWLRPDLSEPAFEKDGFYTVTGAEWAAFAFLTKMLNEAPVSTVERAGR